jgi:hypothetical protein
MTNQKNASIAQLRSHAVQLEDIGRWAEAARVWQRIASHKNASKKTRAEASGRAAAAGVRAEAKSQSAAQVEESMPLTVEEQPAGQPPADEQPLTAKPAPTPVDAPATRSTDAAPTSPTDARMPSVGTVIQKRDRAGAVRCECTVIDGGVEYAGARYTSVSAAAVAASKDLGLTAKTLDGWAWWGLKARTATAANRSSVDVLTRAFEKYRERVAALLRSADAQGRPKLEEVLRSHASTLNELATSTAEARRE